MHHFFFSLVVFLFAVAGSAANSFAQSAVSPHLQQIQSRGSLRVGTTGDYKPFSYRTNAKSPFIGFDIAMAQNLANSLGVNLELVPTSWPSLMSDLAAGRFDVAMSGVSISAEREKLAMFSTPYLLDGKTPIALCSQQQRFQSLEQIDQPNVRVIVNPGGTNERFVREHLRHAQITVYADNNYIFNQIVEGNADLMITDAVEARLQQQLKPSLCAIHPDTPFNVSYKAYLLPQDAQWKKEVDAWLQAEQAKQNGNLGAKLDPWLHHPWPSASVDQMSIVPLRDLIAQRLGWMENVAKHKWNQQSAIEDRPREQKIIASLQQQAISLGIPASWAEHFFRAQIEAAKQIQSDYFAQWKASQQGKFQDVPDLDGQIRPQLDQLTVQILRQLAMTWPALVDPHQRTRINASLQPLLDPQPSSKAVNMAIAPLLDGSAN